MRHAAFLSLLICAGCAFVPDVEKPPEQEARPSPRESLESQPPSPDGRVVYIDPGIPWETDEDPIYTHAPPMKRCRVGITTHEVRKTKVNASPLNFIYETIEEYRKMRLNGLGEFEHLHLDSVQLWSNPQPFEFLAWANVEVMETGEAIAWTDGPAAGSKTVDLQVNGAMDLAPYFKDNEFTLKATVRARAPQKDTTIGAYLTFVRIYDCEE